MATPSSNKPVSKHNSSPQSSAKAAADDDVDDSEPVESGVKGEAKKDMKNVTNYVNEELAQRQVDANKLGKVSVNKGWLRNQMANNEFIGTMDMYT